MNTKTLDRSIERSFKTPNASDIRPEQSVPYRLSQLEAIRTLDEQMPKSTASIHAFDTQTKCPGSPTWISMERLRS